MVHSYNAWCGSNAPVEIPALVLCIHCIHSSLSAIIFDKCNTGLSINLTSDAY